MLNALRSCARSVRRLGLTTGLVAGLLAPVSSALAAPAQAQAPSARDLVGSWLARLEQRATELETAPKVKATRVGYGMVLKKGDGGMVDVPVPGPVQPEGAYTPSSPGELQVDGTFALPAGPAPQPLTLPQRAKSADRVGRVATRLIEMGFLPADQWTESFDDTLEAAVRAFQLAEGLMPDGKVGEVTRQGLDRTPKEAASLMRGAAAAMKTFQPTVPDTVLLVNLPSQTVTYVERGKLQFTMRAVVGRPSRQTPLLQDRVTSVTINPTWTVPPTVLVEDKLPVLRKKGNTGVKNAIVYLDGAEVVPETVNWWSVDPGRIRIVQRPGDDNALGRFRFNLTNGEGIFLHGTNDPKLFDRDLRAASSGCVRLADARQVAETLLRPAKLDSAAIQKQLDSGQTKTVGLPSAVAVRFVYWTATVEPEGTVRVHPGIYDEVSVSAATPAPAPTAPANASTVKRLEPKPARSLPTPVPAPAPTPAQLVRAVVDR
ncbi:L,D-transpeptidase family protein [Azospirillum sp. TSO22-1]|uniref:L,D-transpeptidase family protein n=1 Tax=Azospirillum sp. TSO22-1 TaxID=716789 RepID=UPI000D6043B2|nr:L,D-transpeptidase family protein [Azospirillum sp. TSO22-1]PWC36932.1 hypothetical protein TSO221_28455 [Azospirillum sp. TSO22-1]